MNRTADALAEYQKKVAAGEIEKTKPKTPREKLADNPKSLRAAINCFCFECVGENRFDVKNCTVKECPLWGLRPWQKTEADEAEE